MKLEDALNIINRNIKPDGFMVSFERRDGSVLRSDHFPDKHGGEKLIETEDEAWDLAKKFAIATSDNIVNIYVVDSGFIPVQGYYLRKLKSY